LAERAHAAGRKGGMEAVEDPQKNNPLSGNRLFDGRRPYFVLV